MDYNPRAKLDNYKEGWLVLGITEGGAFASRAASELLRGIPSNPLCGHDTMWYMLRSAMAREDYEACRIYVNDWSRRRSPPSERVSKFIPGQHYHCLGEKFDTLDLAIRHLKLNGYAYGGLKEVHVYREE